MAYESQKMLKSILMSIEQAETLEEAKQIVEYLCDEDEVLAAKKIAEEKQARRNNKVSD